MDAMQMVLPVLGIAAAAAVTFYAVSFSEIREVGRRRRQCRWFRSSIPPLRLRFSLFPGGD